MDYPILGGRMPDGGAALTEGVLLAPMRRRELVELDHYESGFSAGSFGSAVLLRIGAMLRIRRCTDAPVRALPHQENDQILHALEIATALAGVPPLRFATSWVRPVGPSVFAVHGAELRGVANPLVPERRIDRAELKAITRAFKAAHLSPKSLRYSLPIQRLVSANYRSSAGDALVDVWVGLEAALLAKGEKMELQYRMSLRAARLLDELSPRPFIKQFKAAYNDRSEIIHGSGGSLTTQQLARLDWSADVLRRLVALIVKAGRMPDVIALENEMIRARSKRKATSASTDSAH